MKLNWVLNECEFLITSHTAKDVWGLMRSTNLQYYTYKVAYEDLIPLYFIEISIGCSLPQLTPFIFYFAWTTLNVNDNHTPYKYQNNNRFIQRWNPNLNNFQTKHNRSSFGVEWASPEGNHIIKSFNKTKIACYNRPVYPVLCSQKRIHFPAYCMQLVI